MDKDILRDLASDAIEEAIKANRKAIKYKRVIMALATLNICLMGVCVLWIVLS